MAGTSLPPGFAPPPDEPPPSSWPTATPPPAVPPPTTSAPTAPPRGGRPRWVLPVVLTALVLVGAGAVVWAVFLRDPVPPPVVVAPLPSPTAPTTTAPAPTTRATPVGADTAELALIATLDANGVDWFGPCAEATEANIGQVCWGVHTEHPASVIFGLGTPYSEFYEWVLVETTELGWFVTDAVPVSEAPEPPWGPFG